MVVGIPDVVNYTNFGDHRLRGFWVSGVKFPPLPLTFIVALTTLSHYRASVCSVKRLQRYSDLTVFFKWRPSAILDLLDADWDHPRRVLDGLYRCAKFG